MPKQRFAEWLRATAESMKSRVPDHPKGAERFDCFMLRNLADQSRERNRPHGPLWSSPAAKSERSPIWLISDGLGAVISPPSAAKTDVPPR